MSGKSKAEMIYDQTVKQAWADHVAMVDEFMAGKIDIATPCFDDRLRRYLIAAFDPYMVFSLTEALPEAKNTL